MTDFCVINASFIYGNSNTFTTKAQAIAQGYFEEELPPETCYTDSSNVNLMTSMTTQEGLEVGGYLSLILLAGFTFRAIARALNVFDKDELNE